MPLAAVMSLVALLVIGAPVREPHAEGPLWLVPAAADAPPTALATALSQLEDGKAAQALPVLKTFAGPAVVAPYVRLHQGQAELETDAPDAAAASAAAILASESSGYLREMALWLAADAAEAREAWTEAVQALSDLAALPLVTSAMARAQYRLGVAAEEAGQLDVAIRAFTRMHDEFPASDDGARAAAALLRLSPSFTPVTAERLPAALGRADRLFAAGRFRDAGLLYKAVQPLASGENRDHVDLRLAETDARLKRFPAALSALQAYVAAGRPGSDEAEYLRLGVLRDMGRETAYVNGVRAFVERPGDPGYVEQTLNDLGTHYILTDEDEKAAAVFTENYDRFPTGAFAGRAAWKAGWWAFANGTYAETVRLFESAAKGLRRSDYRSGWVYWAARAHERLGQRDDAVNGYLQTIADYGNSYYGREAARALEQLKAAARPSGAGPVTAVRREARVEFDPGAPPSNASLIQALLTAQLYGDAAQELRRIQRFEGNSPIIEATLAYALNRKGDLRPAISAMKRAYPQYMADGGEALPRELLTVLFPVDYWDLIQKHAAEQKLDPFLIAALVAQESTFDREIRSSANAWGLMQILPSTGRQYARTLGIRPFSTFSLTRAEVNVRIGTTFFANLVKRFGDTAPALAAYNAGESRVVRWLAERPGVDRDEFIDGIPFPETQGYVKKIIGTAEDYRLLYRSSAGTEASGR